MLSAELEQAVNDRGTSSHTMRTAKSRIGDRLVTEKNGASWIFYLREQHRKKASMKKRKGFFAFFPYIDTAR